MIDTVSTEIPRPLHQAGNSGSALRVVGSEKLRSYVSRRVERLARAFDNCNETTPKITRAADRGREEE